MVTYPLHSPDFYSGDPFPAYKELRHSSPVVWCEEGQFWGLLKHDDIRHVSTNPALFSSAKGIMIPDPDIPDQVQEGNMVFVDPPRHRQMRKLVSAGFTPKQVAALHPKVCEIVTQIMDSVPRGVPFDFAETVAAPLPTLLIAELLGAAPEDWEKFRQWSDAAVGTADPDIGPEKAMAGGLALFEYFTELIADRRRDPKEDVVSILAAAEVDGERLSDEHLLHFCFLLLVAGNETTRNLIALGTLALINHPSELQKLLDDPTMIPVAVEEMLRWNTPVTHMARTATQDVEIRGTTIRAGEMVVMLYGSGNRDEEVFGEDAEEFRVDRNPNPHLAFGYGQHLCLGASLARLEARVLFEELLRRYPSVELVGEVTRMRQTMVPGVKRMPVVVA